MSHTYNTITIDRHFLYAGIHEHIDIPYAGIRVGNSDTLVYKGQSVYKSVLSAVRVQFASWMLNKDRVTRSNSLTFGQLVLNRGAFFKLWSS